MTIGSDITPSEKSDNKTDEVYSEDQNDAVLDRPVFSKEWEWEEWYHHTLE